MRVRVPSESVEARSTRGSAVAIACSRGAGFTSRTDRYSRLVFRSPAGCQGKCATRRGAASAPQSKWTDDVPRTGEAERRTALDLAESAQLDARGIDAARPLE